MPKKTEGAPTAVKASEKDNRTMMLVAYLFTWLTGLIVYFTAGKEDPEVRFHAVQAILLGIAAQIGFFLFFFPGAILVLYGWYVGYTAYSKGERMMIPVIGEYAVKYSEKA